MLLVLLAGLLVCTMAAVLAITGTTIPYWKYSRTQSKGVDITEYSGLWQDCQTVVLASQRTSICNTITHVSDCMTAVRAMMIIGIFLLALGTLLGCLFASYQSYEKVLYASILSAILAGCDIITALIVFGVDEKENKWPFGAAFYLGAVSAVLAFISGLLLACSKRKNNYVPLHNLSIDIQGSSTDQNA